MLAVRRRRDDDAGMMDAVQNQAPSDEVAMLLVRCAQADGIAFRRLYELQSATLYGVALRITRQPALAADAVHDAGGPRQWDKTHHIFPQELGA